MRLHHLIEDIAPDCVGQDWFERIRTNASEIVGFDFGDVSAIPATERAGLREYALELMANGLFTLPFPSVAFSFSEGGCDCLVLLGDNENLPLFPEGLEFDLTGCVFSRAGGRRVSVGTGIGINVKPDAASGFPRVAYTRETLVDRRHAGKSTHDVVSGALKYVLSTFVSLLAMLNAQGVETKLIPAPTKLNARRAKAGKPAIQDIREVRIRVGARTYAVSGHAEGRHASPRMHWRRGHIRRLSTGKITNVRPCLVGAVGVETPALPSYAVSN